MTEGVDMDKVINSDAELADYGTGSLFLDDATGYAFRLRSWGRNWETREMTKPDFSVLLTEGASTSAKTLPYPVRVVWGVYRTDEAADLG